jgi:AraC-like DNA-binding protein
LIQVLPIAIGIGEATNPLHVNGAGFYFIHFSDFKTANPNCSNLFQENINYFAAEMKLQNNHRLQDPNELFVKDIIIFEDDAYEGTTALPFYADGYPGLVFHFTPGGQWAQPHNKKMPTAYLHGQTLHPIELQMHGAYKMIAFQLYPFVLKSFFGINARDLNNGCFDMLSLPAWKDIESLLLRTDNTKEQIQIILDFLEQLFEVKKQQLDYAVTDAIKIILDCKAQITVAMLSDKVHLTLRTFERRFLKEVGIGPKDFIQIIKFQQSLEQLANQDYSKLSDIVYANGYSDQSHFIRVFKAFTGTTPKRFA